MTKTLVWISQHASNPSHELAAWRRARAEFLTLWYGAEDACQCGCPPCNDEDCKTCNALAAAKNANQAAF